MQAGRQNSSRRRKARKAAAQSRALHACQARLKKRSDIAIEEDVKGNQIEADTREEEAIEKGGEVNEEHRMEVIGDVEGEQIEADTGEKQVVEKGGR